MDYNRVALPEGNVGPRSVEQITSAAQEYDFDANIPIRYWLKTANNLLREVSRIP